MLKTSAQLSALCLIMLGAISFGMFATGPKEWINFIKDKKKAGESFKLRELEGIFDDVPMPTNLKNKFLDLTINVSKLIEQGSVIEISATSNLEHTPITVEFGLTNAIKDFHIGFEIPDGVNFKVLLPELGDIADVMMKLKLGKSFFIFSSHGYNHETLKIHINKGLNIGAVVDFKNLLSDANKILDKLSKGNTEFIIVDQAAAIFRTTLDPFNVKNSSLGVELPLRIGVDFTKKPFNCGGCYIQRIYTANFVEQITMAGQASVQGGLVVEIKDVKDPLNFLVTLMVNPITEVIEIEGSMQGLYKPAFGLDCLALGPILGVKFGVMTSPPWLKSFAIQAGFSLGSVIQGADGLVAVDLLNGGAGFKFALAKFDLESLVVLMIEMIESLKGINKENIKKAMPPLEMSALNVQFMPMAGTYFGVSYPAGLRMSVGEIRIGPFAGGGQVFIKGPKEALQALTKGSSVPPVPDDGTVGSLLAQATAPVDNSLSISRIEGHLFPLYIPNKNKPVLAITGQSKIKINDVETENCAQFLLDVQAGGGSKILKGLLLKFLLTADIEIPPLKFKQHTFIMYQLLKGFVIQCSTQLGDDIFSGSVTIAFQPTKPQNFMFDMKFEQKFIEHIKNKVIHQIAEDLAKVFEIRAAYLHSEGTQIAQGNLGQIGIDMTIFGQDVKLDLAFDFSKIDDIAKAIITKIKEMSAFHVNVTNDTLYPIEAKCSKAGIWPTKGVTILPGETKRAEAGGADWANGLKVTIKAQKDINLTANFGPARPGNVDARVVAIPKFKIEKSGFVLGKTQTTKYSIENTSFGVGIEFDLSEEEMSYQCK